MTKPMTCEESRAVWSAHLDGELDRESSARLAAHLDDCATCRADLESLVVGDQALRGLPAAELEAAELDAMIATVWARVDARETEAPTRETVAERSVPLHEVGRVDPIRLGDRLRSLRGAVLGTESAWVRFAQVAATLLVMAAAGRLIWGIPDSRSPLSESVPTERRSTPTAAIEGEPKPGKGLDAGVDDRVAAGEVGARDRDGVGESVVEGEAVEPQQEGYGLAIAERGEASLTPEAPAHARRAERADVVGLTDKPASAPRVVAPVPRPRSGDGSRFKLQAANGVAFRTTTGSPIEVREAPRQRLRHLPPLLAAIPGDQAKEETAAAPELEKAAGTTRRQGDAVESPDSKKAQGAISTAQVAVDEHALEAARRLLVEAESRAGDGAIDEAVELRSQLEPHLEAAPPAFKARVAFLDLVIEAEQQRGAAAPAELRARFAALDAIAEEQVQTPLGREAALWAAATATQLWRASSEPLDCTAARQAITRVLERYPDEPRAAPCRSWITELDC